MGVTEFPEKMERGMVERVKLVLLLVGLFILSFSLNEIVLFIAREGV